MTRNEASDGSFSDVTVGENNLGAPLEVTRYKADNSLVFEIQGDSYETKSSEITTIKDAEEIVELIQEWIEIKKKGNQ